MILCILMEKDSYGYEISKEIAKRSLNLYEIKETTLYSAMARMEKRGLIAAYYGEETFGKRRTYYTLTQLGREYYQEKCKEWEITRKVIDQFMEEKNHASD